MRPYTIPANLSRLLERQTQKMDMFWELKPEQRIQIGGKLLGNLFEQEADNTRLEQTASNPARQRAKQLLAFTDLEVKNRESPMLPPGWSIHTDPRTEQPFRDRGDESACYGCGGFPKWLFPGWALHSDRGHRCGRLWEPCQLTPRARVCGWYCQRHHRRHRKYWSCCCAVPRGIPQRLSPHQSRVAAAWQ